MLSAQKLNSKTKSNTHVHMSVGLEIAVGKIQSFINTLCISKASTVCRTVPTIFWLTPLTLTVKRKHLVY